MTKYDDGYEAGYQAGIEYETDARNQQGAYSLTDIVRILNDYNRSNHYNAHATVEEIMDYFIMREGEKP